jgi:hypothetical protein
MRQRVLLFLACLLLHVPHHAEQRPALSEKSTGFTENKGQFRDQNGNSNPSVLYMADFGGMKVQLLDNGFSYEIGRTRPRWVDPASIPYRIMTISDRGDTVISWPGQAEAMKNLMYHYHRIDISLEGCNPWVAVTAELQETGGGRRMLIEGSSKIAETNRFGQIRYQDIYPGIDMVCYALNSNGGFKYDFILHPGADPSLIRLNYAGAENLFLNSDGNLEIKTRFGSLTESIPLCYIEDAAGIRTHIEGIHYQLSGNTLKFKGTAIQNRKIVIDPAVNLHWAVFFGGDSVDFCTASVIDGLGNSYLCGSTRSPENIATSGSYQDSLLLPEDGFLTKYSNEGQLVWSTYLSNTPAVDLDIQNNLAVLTGNKIMKFDTDGNFLWQINSMNGLKAICLDNIENMVVVGDSTCPVYGVNFHMDTIIKYNAAGILQWSRSFGKSNTYINDVGLDTAGNIYFVGQTTDSSGIGTENSHLPVYNGTFPSLTGWDYRYELIGNERSGDGFIGKLDPDGQLIFGTYYGGKYFDQVNRISVGNNGTFVIAGETNSRTGISTTGAYNEALNPQGRYGFMKIAIGGAFECDPGWPLIDTCIIGSYFPTPYDWRCQSTDAFIAKFSADGTRLWGTYYGDNGSDFSTCVNTTSNCDTISLGGISPANFCIVYSSDCPPARLASTYSYLKVGDLYSSGTGGGPHAYLAQFDSAGNRIWGTYFPKEEDVTAGNYRRFSISDVNNLKREVVVSGTNYSSWALIDPHNTFLFAFNTSDIDTIFQPNHSGVCLGETTVLSVGVLTDPMADLDFQWMLKGLPVEGATDSVLVIQNTSPPDTGFYYCIITQGDFSWNSDSVNLAVRENPAFDQFSINDQDLLFMDSRLMGDIDNNGFYDFLSQGKITYNDSLSFLRYDSIPLLFSETSLIDLQNDDSAKIFTHDPLCLDVNCRRPSKILTNQSGHLIVYENALLDKVSVWADFDNDGKPEGFKTQLFQVGNWYTELRLVEFDTDTIYEKWAGQVSSGIAMTCIQRMEVSDYDNDGDLDILFIGASYNGSPSCGWNYYALIFLNNGGVFQEMLLSESIQTSNQYAQWFDADEDGDLDILLSRLVYVSANSAFSSVLSVYENDSGAYSLSFTDSINAIQQEYPKPLIFDYNNDGHSDFVFKNLIFQKKDAGYEITPSTFNPAHSGLTEDAMSFGDFDNDGDLDILGVNSLFRNDACNVNSPPSVPPGFISNVTNHGATFSWERSTDAETGQLGLTYNLRVGTTPGGDEIMSSMSGSTGWRRVARMGNVYQNTSWWLHDLQPGKYYCSVQAIDNAYAGGPFSEEQIFIVPDTIVQPVNTSTCIGNATNFVTGVSLNPHIELSYQWYKDDQVISGATDSIFIIPVTSISDTGSYYCMINGGEFHCKTEVVSLTTREYLAFDNIDIWDQSSYTNLFGDINDDRKPDIFNAGGNQSAESRLWINNGTGFTELNSNVHEFYNPSAAFGDYDGDGDLDLTIAGDTNADASYKIPVIFMYRNDAGTFYPTANNFTGGRNGALKWGDFDNDGDLDLVISGSDPTYGVNLCFYRNDFGVFNRNQCFSVDGTEYSYIDLADYDQDGDIDILAGGGNLWDGSSRALRLFENNSGIFTMLNVGLEGLFNCSAVWGDYDSDGDLDIVLNGSMTLNGGDTTFLYRNDAGSFVMVPNQIPGSSQNINFGDYNNDGILDVIAGNNYLENINNNFVLQPTSYSTAHSGITSGGNLPGDYDNDGDLDLLGWTNVCRNDACNPANTPPSAPSGLSVIISNDTVTFSWQPATDLETPQAGLTYNLRVGITPGGNKIMPSMSDSTGWRKIAAMGNVYQSTDWWLRGFQPGTYYWSVQAIDNSYAGGPFATEQSFSIYALSTTWTGTIDSLWNKAGNWSAGLPGENTTVIIPGEPVNQPVLNISTANKKLILQTGSELIINPYKLLNLSDSLIIIQDSPSDSTKLIIKGNIEVIR